MINFSKISEKTFLGNTLRKLLRTIIPKNAVLPIVQGRLRWKKWIVSSGVFGYWLGSYEFNKQKIFIKAVNEGDIVFDIGAHVGFYTLLSSKLVGKQGRVFSFEPLPRNLLYLKRHVEMNKCRNVTIIEVAVSDKDGILQFNNGNNSSVGRIVSNGDMKVKVISLDKQIEKNNFPTPNIIKIDVEGEELKVLRGAQKLLRDNHPILLLATHDKIIHERCCELLQNFGYILESITEKPLSKTDEIFAYPY